MTIAVGTNCAAAYNTVLGVAVFIDLANRACLAAAGVGCRVVGCRAANGVAVGTGGSCGLAREQRCVGHCHGGEAEDGQELHFVL